jgi:replicative DNA helicase
MDYGKIPPQAIDMEKAVLGTVIFESNQIIDIIDLLKPESFYQPENGIIWNTLVDLYSKSQPIDVLSVTENLRKSGKLESVGGMFAISELTNLSTFGIVHHAKIIVQKFIQRELIKISHEIIKESYEDTTDVFDLLDNANNLLLSIQNALTGTNVQTLISCQNSILKKILEVKSGLAKSDEVLTCVPFIKFYKNTVTVIGAKPGTGKTAFILSSALKQAEKGYKVMVISLEMTSDRLTARVIQTKTQIFAKRLISGEITNEEYDTVKDLNLSENVLIDEGIGVNSQNFKTRLVSLYKKYRFDVCYIDYFQKIPMVGKGSSVDLQFNLMETQICAFAKENSVAMCVLSQLTRGENSGLESLRGGGIEQGAQQVYMFIDENINETKNLDFLSIPVQIRGRIKVNCEKNRDDSYLGGEIYFDKLKQVMMDWNLNPNIELGEMVEIKKSEFEIF